MNVKRPHLWAGLLAVGALFFILVLGQAYAESIEARYIHALGPGLFDQKAQGIALQRQALLQPDLLVTYGSSELMQNSPYTASNLFREYPTGFSVFEVGKVGFSSLTLLQKFAALGPDLRGKKIVVFISPELLHAVGSPPEYYTGNFSRLHANALAFSSDLSNDLKAFAARRMLEYPETIAHDPLLRFALERLADDTPLNRALYDAALPLGKLQVMVLELQDHWETLSYIESQTDLLAAVGRHARPLDWPALIEQADAAYTPLSTNNRFGFDNRYWEGNRAELVKLENVLTTDDFIRRIDEAPEWSDLELMLWGLKELGAEPLIVSMPLHGVFLDYMGVAWEGRDHLYARLNRTVQKYGLRLVDNKEYDVDVHFLRDRISHPSPKGWAILSRTLDAFYHSELR